MATYRKEWQDPNGTGYLYRLDIVPYDEDINSTTTAISGAAATLIEVGAVEYGYNDIPYGIINPPTMTLKMCLSELPSALATKIRTKQAGGSRSARNLFLFYCDRGTGGTYTLEFCGVQAKISGTTYSKEAGKYIVTLDLVDALYFGMVSTQMSSLETNSLSTATRYGTLYDVVFPSGSRTSAYHDSRVSATGWSDKFSLHSFTDMVSLVREEISFVLKSVATRTSNVVADVDNTDADTNGAWINDIIGYCIAFYKCATTYPRTQGAALTTLTTRLIGKVYDNDSGDVIGGMTSPRDKYSWAGYESAWDWAKDFFETVNCKASYKPVYNAGGGNPYITWVWSCKPILEPLSGTAKTFNLDDALTFPEVVETEQSVGISETRIETEGSDVKEWKVNAGVSRADRSFTLRANSLHNLPTFKPDYVVGAGGDPTKLDAVSKGLFQTNLVCYTEGSDAVKVHEDVRLWKDASTSTLYEALEGADNLSETPPNEVLGDVGLTNYNLWVNAVQTYGGLPYALAKHINSIFGNDNVAQFDVDIRINSDVTKVLNDNIGEVFDLSSSAIATELSHLAWTTAVVTNIKADHVKNISTVTFTLVP